MYSFCTLTGDECGLGKIGNLDGKNPYQGIVDVKLKIPNENMLKEAWEEFKKCNTSKEIKDIFLFYEDTNFNYDE